MSKKSLLVMLATAALSFTSVNVYAIPIAVELQYEDPTNNQNKPQKSPIQVPQVTIDDHTLTFVTPCEGCELRLLDEDGQVVYTTVITSGTLVLPSTLTGNYELQIVCGGLCFYGYICL